MAEVVGNLFDKNAEYEKWERCRPHRLQSSTITFLTLRLKDSLPAEVIRRWHRERLDFLYRLGIDCGSDWKRGREQLNLQQRAAFDKTFQRVRELTLDNCLGQCELAVPDAARIVASSLESFHEDRCWMGDYVIMPNHIHCLVAFRCLETAKKLPGSWMRYTATQINRRLGRNGPLWFPEPFDHLVRNDLQLSYLRKYIRSNPEKAGLTTGKFLYRQSEGHF